jgi:hypothetical protein
MIERSTPLSEQPRNEPEIFPPDPERRGPPHHAYVYATHRVYAGRVGLFSIVIAALAVAVLMIVIGFILLGALLFWIPVAAVLVAVAVIAGMLRR